MFAKKKSFKQVSFVKSTYFKMMIVPLFFLGYFIHSYAVSHANLTFRKTALPYFRLSVSANYILYSNLTAVQNAFLSSNNSLDTLEIGT